MEGGYKENGAYDQVTKALKGYKVVELSGIEPNQAYETCMESVKVLKKEKIDFLLAVGRVRYLMGRNLLQRQRSLKEGIRGNYYQKALE